MTRRVASTFAMVAAALGSVPTALAQSAPSKPQPGYPITDKTVIQNCGSCHVKDSTGRLGRLSYLRKTPEGWQASVRRMVTLHGVKLEPEAAREVVRYLATYQGLAPEEARPGRFESERRMIDYRYTADTAVEQTCRMCHSMGRIVNQRRTAEEWELLLTTHVALRHGYWDYGPAGAQSPGKKASTHFSTVFPLDTPEWRVWATTLRPPRLEGRWLMQGDQLGSGPIHGVVTITPKPGAPDEFTSEATYTYLRDGRKVTRRGRSIVYTGFQWRGRSNGAPGDSLREVMFVERDWNEMSGRWFWGSYDEFGIDVKLRRIDQSVAVSQVLPASLRTGAAEQELAIYGANLPAGINPTAIDLGSGVKVTAVTGSGDMVRIKAAVEADARIGWRDVFFSGARLTQAFVVYDKIDHVEVTPRAGMARIGGVVHPKQLQAFDAIAYQNGPDGKPNTGDDLPLGYVPVTWSIDEYPATFNDDDLKFVGSIDKSGLFTPNVDGPNPARAGSRNNIGDVWVIATYAPPGSTKPLRARAHLLVTVPLYMTWDSWRANP